MKVCHITAFHPVFDTRIFHKECKSLSKAKFEVHLIVKTDKDETVDNIYIHSIPNEKMIKISDIIIKKAIEIDADIYHFHDYQLIPIGLKLKKLNKKVIYDVHEDYPSEMLSNTEWNNLKRFIKSFLFKLYENGSAKKFDAIVAATPHIRDRFFKINPNTIDINNFPILDELFLPTKWEDRKNEICYIGGITKIRGIIEIVQALKEVDTTLHLAGPFLDEKLKEEVSSLEGWQKVRYYGFVDRQKAKDILKQVKIGIVLFHPHPNHIYALPNKMFEYMSAGIPVIASYFPLWKEIIEKNECGICVDPLNIKEIANTIKYLLSSDNIAKKFGENARKLIETKYNWEIEEKKLINLYQNLLS
jgi:glycosyltransferase involved in cell wall biosynthesis